MDGCITEFGSILKWVKTWTSAGLLQTRERYLSIYVESAEFDSELAASQQGESLNRFGSYFVSYFMTVIFYSGGSQGLEA